jgi:hypothetical protein
VSVDVLSKAMPPDKIRDVWRPLVCNYHLLCIESVVVVVKSCVMTVGFKEGLKRLFGGILGMEW